ncbi:MAG: TIR domain-containing protein [Theionarchaea archaeon]|nr:TIR domain-containing protein [Theionarchaea archaeon]
MKVFLSWSGKRSKETADVLCEWLPQVIQAVEPWTSSEMDKGILWESEIANALGQSKVGIICLTRENLSAPWILFEAGALSRSKNTHVCTFLLDLKPTDIENPLALFQHTQFGEEDILKLILTINKLVNETGEHSPAERTLNNLFAHFWPELRNRLQEIAEEQPGPDQPIRKEREMLEEILELSREQGKQLGQVLLKEMPSRRLIKDRILGVLHQRGKTTNVGDVIRELKSYKLESILIGLYWLQQEDIITLPDGFHPDGPIELLR